MPKYIGPQFFNDVERHNWIPINVKSVYAKCCQSTRSQFPIRLSYALTTHKVQGDTLELGFIIIEEAKLQSYFEDNKTKYHHLI